MKYLYGDSSAFPLTHNFLATLEAFVPAAAQALKLQAESRATTKRVQETIGNRNQAQTELDAFHRTLFTTLHQLGMHAMSASVGEYTAQLKSHASALLEDARRSGAQANERDMARRDRENKDRDDEIRTILERFFIAARLPVLSARLVLTLEKNAYALSAAVTYPETIEAGFELAADAVETWKAPRKVSDFAHDLDWQVGTRKSWIKRTPQPEIVHIDDFFIGGFEMTHDVAGIRLRKKPELPDALIFRVARETTGLVAEVERPGEDATDGALPPLADPEERAELEQLWVLLRHSAEEALDHKRALTSLTLAGEPVFATDRVDELVRRLVHHFGPIVSEIAKRSPNAAELSLKKEGDDGRREEIYLRKSDLETHLARLGSERGIFAPLHIGHEGELELVEIDD